ncbi:MAG: TssQ family T6SS-associated lipoprotein [Aquabacterium sp.]
MPIATARFLLIAWTSALLSACVTTQPPAAAPMAGVSELAERPAERALLAGMRLYDEAMYAQSERALRQALGAGLQSPRDRAAAHKLLAFILCTSERVDACEGEFRAARVADPQFALSRSEVGHPTWGPVYRRVHPQ